MSVIIHMQHQTVTPAQGANVILHDLVDIPNIPTKQESADSPRCRTYQEVLLEDDILEKADEPLLKILMLEFSHLVLILRPRWRPRRAPSKNLHSLQLLLRLLKLSRLVDPPPQVRLRLILHNWACSPRLCLHRLRLILSLEPHRAHSRRLWTPPLERIPRSGPHSTSAPLCDICEQETHRR